MIQKLNPILEEATRKNRGVGAFTATTFEILRAIIEVAEKRGEPVIIKHSATYEDEVPLKYMGPVIIELAKKAKVDICPMLDHCKDTDYIKTGLKMGFTAVMYDGADLPFEENVKMGKEVVSLAKSANANIEASFGFVGGHKSEASTITDVEQLMKFIREVDIDALAPSVGNTHSTTAKQQLNFNLLKEISEKTNLPLVLHGAGTLPKEDIRRAIECGVRKINYFLNAGIKEVQDYLANSEVFTFSKMTKIVVDAIKKDIEEAMAVFSMK